MVASVSRPGKQIRRRLISCFLRVDLELTNDQKARSHRAFWQSRQAKSATQTSGEIRDPTMQNPRPLSSPSSQCSEHPTRSRSAVPKARQPRAALSFLPSALHLDPAGNPTRFTRSVTSRPCPSTESLVSADYPNLHHFWAIDPKAGPGVA